MKIGNKRMSLLRAFNLLYEKPAEQNETMRDLDGVFDELLAALGKDSFERKTYSEIQFLVNNLCYHSALLMIMFHTSGRYADEDLLALCDQAWTLIHRYELIKLKSYEEGPVKTFCGNKYQNGILARRVRKCHEYLKIVVEACKKNEDEMKRVRQMVKKGFPAPNIFLYIAGLTMKQIEGCLAKSRESCLAQGYKTCE